MGVGSADVTVAVGEDAEDVAESAVGLFSVVAAAVEDAVDSVAAGEVAASLGAGCAWFSAEPQPLRARTALAKRELTNRGSLFTGEPLTVNGGYLKTIRNAQHLSRMTEDDDNV